MHTCGDYLAVSTQSLPENLAALGYAGLGTRVFCPRGQSPLCAAVTTPTGLGVLPASPVLGSPLWVCSVWEQASKSGLGLKICLCGSPQPTAKKMRCTKDWQDALFILW